MRKKHLITICALVCACSLVGCASIPGTVSTEESQAASNSAEEVVTLPEEIEATLPSIIELEPYATNDFLAELTEPEPAPSYAVYEAPTELSDNILDFQVSVNGTVHQFPMWYSDFEDLGWTYTGDPSETLNSHMACYSDDWTIGGLEVDTNLTNFSSSTKPYSECSVTGISFVSYNVPDDSEIKLPKDIIFGKSTYEDVVAAYGTPSYENKSDDIVIVEYSIEYDQCVRIAFNETGAIFSLDIDNQIELEGTDHSVDTTVPEIVKNYVEPTAISEDFSGYSVEYEGNYYTLPCPVTVLMENGFELSEGLFSSTTVAADDYTNANFNYNGESFSAYLYNFADYATIPENCFVIALEAKSEYAPTVDMTIPYGITIGSKEEDVMKVLENYEYDSYESTVYDYVTYFIQDPNSYRNSYEITIEGGVVTGLKAECRTSPAE